MCDEIQSGPFDVWNAVSFRVTGWLPPTALGEKEPTLPIFKHQVHCFMNMGIRARQPADWSNPNHPAL